MARRDASLTDPAPGGVSGEPWVVEAAGLTKSYGAVEAVRGIDFRVKARERFGFLGVNGAGKTTTMKMIYCRIARTAGTLNVFGLDASANPIEIKRRIGVVAQEGALDSELTVNENLLLYAAFFGIGRAAAQSKASELLRFVGLEGKGKAHVRELSGGMKRRLSIARSLMNDPDLLVLDEPTTGLDPQGRLLVWEKLSLLRAQGVTLLLTTHYMEEAARLCDRLVVMDAGRVYAEGTPSQLIAQYAANDVLEIACDAAALPDAAALDGLLRRSERHGETSYLYTDDGPALLGRLSALGFPSRRHVARPATLEDVFLNITGRDLAE